MIPTTGKPWLHISSGTPSQVEALKVGGGAIMAVLRSVRVVHKARYYYEATLTSLSNFHAPSGRRIYGIRLGWALCGFSYADETMVGDTSTSFGFDGAKHRVYCSARSRIPPPPPPTSEDEPKTPSSSPPPPPPPGEEETPRRPERSISIGGSSDASELLLGLGRLFVEREEEEEACDIPDGGVDFSSPGEPWKVGDVVGCLIDMEAKTMAFQVNGVVQVSE